jgi:hypothetical protein
LRRPKLSNSEVVTPDEGEGGGGGGEEEEEEEEEEDTVVILSSCSVYVPHVMTKKFRLGDRT